MKEEEIERLLAAYASAELSPADQELTEKLFRENPGLRKEAEEMSMVWKSLDEIGDKTIPDSILDERFSSMLSEFTPGKKPVVSLIKIINRILIPAAACFAAFLIGRVTTEQSEIIKYKTTIVKVPVKPVEEIKEEHALMQQDVVAAKPAAAIQTENLHVLTPLERQLQSDFSSERMEAIMQLSGPAITESATLKVLGDVLMKDPNPNIRLMVIKKLQPFLGQQPVQTLLIGSLNRQEDTMIQDAVLDLLIQARSRQAIPQMITLLENNNTSTMVQSKIKEGIERFLY